VLQPLDLLCFSPVKLKYWKQIVDLASLDDVAPIKKHRFIKYYYKAREKGLIARRLNLGGVPLVFTYGIHVKALYPCKLRIRL